MRDGEVSSLGERMVFGKQTNNENIQKVVPDLAVCLGDDGMKVVGEYIWQGGTLGNLWESQIETLKFILGNIDNVQENR